MRTTDGGKVVHVNDIDLFYQDYGSGSPLVLLHGWFGSNAFWDPYINALTQEYRVIVPDFRGHGRSTNPNDYAFSERDFAHDIFALLDHLGIERFKGVGFSSGGMTFLHMATEQSKRIEAMILIGTVHDFPWESTDIASEMTMENLEPEFLALLQKWHKQGDEQIRFLVNLFDQGEMKLSPDSLAGITAHTLIIHGDRDEFFPVSIALEMYQAIPQSYLWVVPNASHGFFFDVFGGKAPGGDLFPKLALEFLRGDWVSA